MNWIKSSTKSYKGTYLRRVPCSAYLANSHITVSNTFLPSNRVLGLREDGFSASGLFSRWIWVIPSAVPHCNALKSAIWSPVRKALFSPTLKEITSKPGFIWSLMRSKFYFFFPKVTKCPGMRSGSFFCAPASTSLAAAESTQSPGM